MEHLVIGICGGTGSGKTTLAQKIYNALEKDALLISMDCYYKNNAHLPFEERIKTNYDHPDAFDVDLLISHIKALKENKDIDYPTYNFSTHLRSEKWIHAKSKKIIIIEGIMLFAIPEIVELLDYKIFVDTDADVHILRRMLRDVKERGRDLDSVANQYLSTVKPMHETYIEPFKKRYSDIIVPEGGYNKNAFDMIVSTIVKKIEDDNK